MIIDLETHPWIFYTNMLFKIFLSLYNVIQMCESLKILIYMYIVASLLK